MKEALLYERRSGDRVTCRLCAHSCQIGEGKTGRCLVRKNQKGRLYSLVYGRLIAAHTDPIEKKPLYHIQPGSSSYSIATVGCNLRCTWCQNWEISQMPLERGVILGDEQSPEQTVTKAHSSGCRSIAYTYTEPTIFFEYALDTARLAHEAGLKNVFVTNGYMSSEALVLISPYLDAANVDLKAFRDETYQKYTGARLAPVLESLRKMKELGIWIEITTLLIPGINDDDAELREAVAFIVGELGPDTPWHISRFHPSYRLGKGSITPRGAMERALAIGREAGLRYIYMGNIGGETNTVCHQCGALLIRRDAFWVLKNNIAPGSVCPQCGTPIAGVEMVS